MAALASTIILRRASSSLLPRRSLLAATSAAAADVDSSLVVPLSRRFSTSSCSDLVRKLDAEYDCAKKRTTQLHENICVPPPGFPFRIEHTEWRHRVILSRRYGEDEIVKARVSLLDCHTIMIVKISKERGNSELLFHIFAYPNSIEIVSLYLKKDLWGIIDDRDRLQFDELNEETKEGWYKYLEMRGFNVNTTKSLLASWAPVRKSLDHAKWLYKLNKFMAGRSLLAATSAPDVASQIADEDDLVRMLDVETERYTKETVAWEPRVPPPDFPFRIGRTELDDVVILSRRYEDEIIKVKVCIKEEEEDEEEQKEKEKDCCYCPTSMTVTIMKESCNSELLFEMWVYIDRIAIEMLFVKEDISGYIKTGRNPYYFDKLNEELKEGFYKYLDMRGINLTTANLFRKKKMCGEDKKMMEHRDWLCGLKEFLA